MSYKKKTDKILFPVLNTLKISGQEVINKKSNKSFSVQTINIAKYA